MCAYISHVLWKTSVTKMTPSEWLLFSNGAPSDFKTFNPSNALVGLDMKDANNRLKTFEGRPEEYIDPRRLASAGFYYGKVDDIIKCPFCKREMREGDMMYTPLEEHKTLSPDCPYIGRKRVGNIVLSPSAKKSKAVSN
jgi:Inhibitor of Apoptosis domain